MESGDEDDAFTMGEREWQKMNRDLTKQGYRDGKNEGREKRRQQAFEQAISLAFEHSLKLGQIVGLIEWKLTQPLNQIEKEKLKTIREQVLDRLHTLRQRPENADGGAHNTKELLDDLRKLTDELLSLTAFTGENLIIQSILTAHNV